MDRANSFLSNAQRWGKILVCNEVCKYLQTLSKFLFKTFFCFRKSFLIFLLCKVEHCVFIFNFLFHIKNHSFFIIVVETGFHHVLVIIGAEKIKHAFYQINSKDVFKMNVTTWFGHYKMCLNYNLKPIGLHLYPNFVLYIFELHRYAWFHIRMCFTLVSFNRNRNHTLPKLHVSKK